MPSAALRLAFLSVLIAAPPAMAALQFGTAEFQVNTYTTDYEHDPAVCAGGDGTFVVVWESGEGNSGGGQDGGQDGVFGQRYDSSGNPLGAEFQVNSYTIEDQNDADVCCAGDGSFVVVWESDEQDGYGNGVFAQRFSTAGAPVGGQFQVNTYSYNSQGDPRVCCADSSFVVVWESQQDGDGYGVFGQRFSSSTGSPLGAEFQVNTYTSSYQDDAAICCRADGAFVVVWEDESGLDGDSDGIFGRRYATSGAPQALPFQVNAYTPESQADPAICCGAGGSFVVAWDSYLQDASDRGVFARRFTAAGAPEGEFQVNTYTSAAQENPALCCGADGFVAVWESREQDGEEDGVFAQEFDGAGFAVGAEFQVNVYTTSNQSTPVVACAPGGEVLVAWPGGFEDSSANQDGDSSGVFARLLVEPLTILEIPTLAPPGLLALAGLLSIGAVMALRRRR